MGHLVAREPWGVIDLDTTTGRVFVQEDWYYEWNLWAGVTEPWTYEQKRRVHTRIDRQVWGIWSNRIRLTVRGSSQFAQRFGRTVVPVNFDVRWDVRPPAHWTVRVWKMPPGAGPTDLHHSHVLPGANIVELNTADLAPRGAGNHGGGSTTNFLTAPHEYGHTIGAPHNFLEDEYDAGDAHLHDTNSLMNVGRELRRRHIQGVLTALERLVPRTRFESNLPA